MQKTNFKFILIYNNFEHWCMWDSEQEEKEKTARLKLKKQNLVMYNKLHAWWDSK